MRLWLALAPLLLSSLTSSAGAQQMVVVVRHAERADDSEDAPLSTAGVARAERLAALLRDAGIDTVFTSLLQRTVKTAEPLAKQRKLAIARVDGRKTSELVTRLKKEHARSRVMIVGHSNTVPEILEAYGLPRMPDIPASEYDNVWILTPQADGPARVVRLRF